MSIISLVGCMGCGKSSWTNVLRHEGYHATMEDLGQNYFLNQYWHHGSYAFHTQISFYTQWLSQYLFSSQFETVIMDSSIIAHHGVFTNYMYSEGILTESEYSVCCDLYNSILELTKCKFIYFRCDEHELYKRIRCRNRASELNTKEYIHSLFQRFESVIAHDRHITCSIDITNLSPNRKEDIEKLLLILES